MLRGMSPGRNFLRVFDSLTDRILCVVGAVLFSQGPEFMQQYFQRLGGHLDEARRHLAAFQKTADQAGLTLNRFISQTAANADPAVAKLGGVMNDAIERVNSLQTAHDALLHAALWERPFVFLRHFDPGIARAAGTVYQPAVPTTTEGLIYAFAGMVFILTLYHFGLKRLLRLFVHTPSPAKGTT